MWSACWDPTPAGFVTGFSGAMRAELVGVTVAVLVGVAAVLCLVILDAVRSRPRGQPRREPTSASRPVREAA